MGRRRCGVHPHPIEPLSRSNEHQPIWTQEAAADPRRVVRNPDPKSRIGAIRVIGYSPAAGFVLTVIMDAFDQAGITAWKTPWQ